MYDYCTKKVNINKLDEISAGYIYWLLCWGKWGQYQNNYIFNVAYKSPHGENLLCISFDGVDGCIEECDRGKYLSLFHLDERYRIMFDKIKYLLVKKKQYFRYSSLRLHEYWWWWSTYRKKSKHAKHNNIYWSHVK